MDRRISGRSAAVTPHSARPGRRKPYKSIGCSASPGPWRRGARRNSRDNGGNVVVRFGPSSPGCRRPHRLHRRRPPRAAAAAAAPRRGSRRGTRPRRRHRLVVVRRRRGRRSNPRLLVGVLRRLVVAAEAEIDDLVLFSHGRVTSFSQPPQANIRAVGVTQRRAAMSICRCPLRAPGHSALAF